MIEDRFDQQRGCGWRKPGGLYMVGGNLMAPCGKLPIQLAVCPCCNAGIKPTRGFTWVGKSLFESAPCATKELSASICRNCPPFDGSQDKIGLIWIGGSFYKTPEDFLREARTQGISRRIPAVPRDFIVGESWVVLAHREGMDNPTYISAEITPDEDEKIPAAISAFRPTHIEYVVKGTETKEEIEAMEKRGITCVKIHKPEGSSNQLNIEEE